MGIEGEKATARSLGEMAPTDVTWLVLNQECTKDFRKTLSYASGHLGPCLLVTGTPEDAAYKGVTVLGGRRYRRDSLRGRLLSSLRFAWKCRIVVKRVTRQSRSRPFVVSVTNPPFLPLLAWWQARRYRIPLVVLVYDMYPDHVVAAGLLRDTNPIIRSWRALNRKVYRDASVVMTIGEGMASELRRHLAPDSASRDIWVIPVGADTEFFRPVAKADSSFAVEHRLLDRFCVMYAGNMGLANRLQTLIEAADRLRNVDGVRFVLVGDGQARPELERQVVERALQNVTLVDRVPWEEMPQVLGAADMAIVSLAPKADRLSAPSKVYSLLASGKPILALTESDSDLAVQVRTHDAGIVASHKQVDELVAKILAIADNPTSLARMQKNALEASKQYSLEAIASQWVDALSAVQRA